MNFYGKIEGKKIDVFKCSIEIQTKPILSPKMIILTLFEHLKPIKTDRKSIVVSDSLDIMSRSRLKWPFMPKQGPRCLILDPIPLKPIQRAAELRTRHRA